MNGSRVVIWLSVACAAVACDAPDPATPIGNDSLLVERARISGIDFQHHNGAAGKKLLIEINSGCVTVLDYDQDGLLDLLFGQGQPMPGYPDDHADFRDRLYRNLGNLQFQDVTTSTQVAEPGYTFHVAAVDYDGDTDQDLYFCNYGRNRMLRNDDGKFVDVTDAVGGDSDRWSTAAAFADFDQDGDLDLYVANYCDYPLDAKACGDLTKGESYRAYCAPDEFPGAYDQFYRNDNGRFVDITEAAGMGQANGSALGLVISDYDDDGDIDLFVANDGRPNLLWQNQGNLQFRDEAWNAGVAVGSHGTSEACMGTDFADIDRDGDLDLMVTNLAVETNTLYRNDGHGMFEDQSIATGLGAPSRRFVGFGCKFFDVDNDADVDVFVANGHVVDNIHLYEPSQTFRQRPHLYANDGTGRYRECGEEFGAYFITQTVGRGAATADLDNDGDLDLVVSHNNGPPALLENRAAMERSWIGFDLRQPDKNHFAIGARVTLWTESGTMVDEVRGTSSYAAFHDLRLHFGLGSLSTVTKAQIRWPDGKVLDLEEPAVRQYHRVER